MVAQAFQPVDLLAPSPQTSITASTSTCGLGRGMSVAGVTRKSRDQNSLWPVR